MRVRICLGIEPMPVVHVLIPSPIHRSLCVLIGNACGNWSPKRQNPPMADASCMYGSVIQLSSPHPAAHSQPVINPSAVLVRPAMSKKSEAGVDDAPVCDRFGSFVLHDTGGISRIRPRIFQQGQLDPGVSRRAAWHTQMG